MRLRFSPTRLQLGYILVTPALVLLAVVIAFPIVRTTQLSFTFFRLTRVADPEFIGFANYVKLFTDERFYGALANTVVYIVGVTAGIMLLGMLMALVMDASFKGRGIIRSAILIPWAIPPIIVSRTWAWIFNGIYGIANYILLRLGLIDEYVSWLNEVPHAMFSVQVAAIWRGAPFASLLLLAGLQSISRELYEAAYVDGATVRQRFFRITIPSLMPTISVALIFTTLNAFKSFDIIYGMTRGGPMESTETLMIYSYTHLFTFLQFGYGSAAIVMLVLVSLAFAVGYIGGFRVDFGGTARQ